MAQQVKLPATKPDDLSLIPERGENKFPKSPSDLFTLAMAYLHVHTHTTNKNVIFKK